MTKKAWKKVPLGSAADLCLGKMLDKDKNRGEPLPYLANVNVRWGEFDLSQLRTMRFEPHERERYGLRFGDIVMCEGGEPGRCAIWKEEVPGMMIQKALHRIRARDTLDHRFLYYNLLNLGRHKGFDQFFTGATIKHLPGEKLSKIEVFVPPMKTQHGIVEVLSAYDELIENSQLRIKILESMARALYLEWFVKPCLREGGVLQPATELPSGWALAPLDAIAEVRLGKMLDQNKNRGELRPYLANVNVRWGEFELGALREMRFEQHELDTYGLRTGDIVMCEGGEPGRCAVWREQLEGMMFQKALHRIRTRTGMSFVYLYHSLRYLGETGALAALFTGSTIKHLPLEKLKNVRVRLPPADLLARFDSIAGDMESQIFTLQRRIQNLRRTRDLLLPRLMSGQLELHVEFPA